MNELILSKHIVELFLPFNTFCLTKWIFTLPVLFNIVCGNLILLNMKSSCHILCKGSAPVLGKVIGCTWWLLRFQLQCHILKLSPFLCTKQLIIIRFYDKKYNNSRKNAQRNEWECLNQRLFIIISQLSKRPSYTAWVWHFKRCVSN